MVPWHGHNHLTGTVEILSGGELPFIFYVAAGWNGATSNDSSHNIHREMDIYLSGATHPSYVI